MSELDDAYNKLTPKQKRELHKGRQELAAKTDASLPSGSLVPEQAAPQEPEQRPRRWRTTRQPKPSRITRSVAIKARKMLEQGIPKGGTRVFGNAAGGMNFREGTQARKARELAEQVAGSKSQLPQQQRPDNTREIVRDEMRAMSRELLAEIDRRLQGVKPQGGVTPAPTPPPTNSVPPPPTSPPVPTTQPSPPPPQGGGAQTTTPPVAANNESLMASIAEIKAMIVQLPSIFDDMQRIA